ncbi:hypothetical protein F7Q99_29145 [Streptomyces kaniharaensis]|uniref:Uncharacterized protein n=1 Tax=Streptomyces kaniharaensis TaxID=212423 RepID=A0A6N7KWY8_9ACTN|nr:hypothetical protein [Streptomyces kaniharaensis]MQS16186.1 hypothetical protein [Streptomyces kaniharaensis]
MLADAGGRRLVLTAFRTIIRCQGTSVDRAAIELVAMDAATHQQAWTVPVDLPQGYTDFTALPGRRGGSGLG